LKSARPVFSKDQSRSVTFAAIAGVTRARSYEDALDYGAKNVAIPQPASFSSFLLKAFVSRVSRRMLMRMVKFWRSTKLVEI